LVGTVGTGGSLVGNVGAGGSVGAGGTFVGWSSCGAALAMSAIALRTREALILIVIVQSN
jgi:hypothetical protein